MLVVYRFLGEGAVANVPQCSRGSVDGDGWFASCWLVLDPVACEGSHGDVELPCKGEQDPESMLRSVNEYF